MTISEKYERADNELFHVNEAIEHLNGVRDADGAVTVLKDLAIVLEFEREALHKMLEEQNRREDAELTKEYWLSVI